MSTNLLSAPEVCRRTGVSYRQLDYLVRTGALAPTVAARGSGTHRRFSSIDVLAVAVAGHLRALGARTEVVLRAVEAVQNLPDPTMEGLLVVGLEASTLGFYGDTELEDMGVDELLALITAGWVVRLPPPAPRLLDALALTG